MSEPSTNEYLVSETQAEEEVPAESPNLQLGQTFEAAEETEDTWLPPQYVEVELPPVDDVIAEVKANPIE